MKKGSLKYADDKFLHQGTKVIEVKKTVLSDNMTTKEKLQEELLSILAQCVSILHKEITNNDFDISYESDIRLKMYADQVDSLQSELAELKEESIAKTETDTGHLIDMPELEKPSGAEEILERYAEGINEDGSPYLSNKSIIKAMEEHRQQGRPTEEEIGYKADEHSEFIGVGGIKNNNIARQVSFMQGARWAINKWKGE